LRRLAFDLVAGTAGTPRRNFAVSKSLTQSLTVGGVASKRREYTESRSAPRPSRALRALGHEPRIIPAICVKPFVKGQKNDYNDAEAIAEAALRGAGAPWQGGWRIKSGARYL
jgi:hypothetical protein